MKSLFVAWRPAYPDQTGWRPIGRLEFDDSLYRFYYTRGARNPDFQPLWGMENLEQIFESTELFPVFKNRLLSESRSEYEDFLRWSGFDRELPPDPVAILAVSEGRRETDAIEVFPCPQPDGDRCFCNRFFLHGIRWLSPLAIGRVNQLQPGETLKLMPDPQNDYDPHAVGVRCVEDRAFVGYVPRYLARDVGRLFDECGPRAVTITVNRVNLDAPLQNRVLCEMKACWPDGFRPCSDDDFLPIAKVPARVNDAVVSDQ